MSRLSIQWSISSSGTYVVLRVGWYSNKAESNSIHWTEESVGQQRGAAELLLQARQRRQTARLGRTRNSGKLIRLTLVSFLPSSRRKKKKSHFSLFLFFQGRSTHSPSSLSSSPPSARPHQLYITKSLCARVTAWKLQRHQITGSPRLTLKSKSRKPETI